MPKKKKCIQCGEEIKYQYTTTQKTCSIACQLQWNTDHPKEVKSFLQQLEEREWKKKKKVMKEKLKKLSDYEADARKPFQRWVRLRDQAMPCISCGSVDSPTWDAGHYLKAELYSGMIFIPENVHKQCRKCNYYLDGNEVNFRQGLIKRYNEDYVKNLEGMKDSLRQYKYSREELIKIKDDYQNKLRNALRGNY